MLTNPKIIVRMRPLLKFEDEPAWIATGKEIKCMQSKAVKNKLSKSHSKSKHKYKNGNAIDNDNSQQAQFENYQFAFDRVIDSMSSQKIYKAQIRKIVDMAVHEGKNCTVVAYGQTCSGKTYTLLGVKEAPGFIPCIFRDLFANSGINISITISYIQIYNQKLIDLLNHTNSTLKIVSNSEWGAEVAGSTKTEVKSFQNCLDVLDIGENNRKYGQKINHQKSSRSHTLLRIYIEHWDRKKSDPNKIQSGLQYRRSIINVVDLAGSQRLDIAQGNAQETGHINKSLFQFSNVISKLSEGRDQHIPYRDSKLTRLLQNSLTKNSNLAIVFCISPAVGSFKQSVSTLRLASKAKKVEIENDIMQLDQQSSIKKLNKIIKQQESQIKILKQKIHKLSKQINKLTIEKQKIGLEKQKHGTKGQARGMPSNSTNNNANVNVNINAMILLDHQNFLLSIDKSLANIDISNKQLAKIKQKFTDQLAALYSNYAKSIIKNCHKQANININSQFEVEESWMHVQQLCFINLVYDQYQLLHCKVAILRQYIDNLGQSQGDQFAPLIYKYIQTIQEKLGANERQNQNGVTVRKNNTDPGSLKKIKNKQNRFNEYNNNHDYIHNHSRQKQKCSKYLSQSPIFQQSTIEVVETQNQNRSTIKQKQRQKNRQNCQIGNLILNWGCKKDCRVFKDSKFSQKSANNQSNIISHFDGIQDLIKVSCGAHHTLVLTQTGQVYGWGKNEHGQLTHSRNLTISMPKQINFGPIKIKKVAAGWAHSIALSSQGFAYSFGYGEDGQLGHGTKINISQPKQIQIEGQPKIMDVYAGHSHSGLIDNQGNYYAFGFNKDYRLMIAQTKQANRPIKVNLKGIVKAALGVTHSCLLSKQGKIYCGGVGTNGQLGVELDPTITGYQAIAVTYKNFQQNSLQKVCPMVQVDFFNGTKIIDISCGQCSTAVITQNYELFTFGKTSFDRLGHQQQKITKILQNVNRIQMGYRHGFAWNDLPADKKDKNSNNNSNKEIYGWGFNMYNQLGSLQAKDLKYPQLVQSVSNYNVIELSTGFFHSCAIAQ